MTSLATKVFFQTIFIITNISIGWTKDCPGTAGFLNAENINDFEHCLHVRGNLVLNEESVNNSSRSLTYDDFFKLKHIREIDGYLQVEHLNHAHINNLRFLRNLENIHGQETINLFGFQNYSLLIQNNPHLVTLNLASLRSVENGGLRIIDNPQLCLVDSISFEHHLDNYSFSRIGGYSSDCSGVTCHGQCVEEQGCWGTLPDECIACRSYKFLETCVDTCNLSISAPQHDRRECMPVTSDNFVTMTTFTLGRSTNSSEQQNSSTTADAPKPTSISEHTIPIQRKMSDVLIPSLIPTGVVILAMLLITIFLATYCRKRKKCKAISLNQQKHSNMTGTPEKYSRNGSDKMILVASCDEGDASSSFIRRSTNVSMSSLASASIHSEDRKDDLTQSRRAQERQPSLCSTAAQANMTLTRRNSPMEQCLQANTNSSVSYYTSGGDTDYSSVATSRKPSLIGSTRTSSTSLRQPLPMGGAIGNVYSTGQHQLQPHRQLYHHQQGSRHQRSKSSITNYQTSTSLGNVTVKSLSNDRVNISSLAGNSGIFED